MTTIKRETIPRELLKWFQTLDLSYSIKNPRRDFANGFLIAEIFSRYYPDEISMHSFENGLSLDCKKNNWGQIMKFLDKIEVKYSMEEVDAIIFCNEGYIIPFLTRSYKHVTNRSIKLPVNQRDDKGPGYAQITGSTQLHLSMKNGDVADAQDTEYVSGKMRNSLESHETKLQDDKILNPGRYNTDTPTLPQTRTVKGVNRSITISKPPPAVEVKQIQVKQIEKNVTHVRAQIEMQATSTSASRLESSASITSPIKDDVQHPVGPLSILDFFDKLSQDQHEIDEHIPTPFISLTDLLSKREGVPNYALDAFNEIFAECTKNIANLIRICSNSPREFWNLTDLLYPILQYLPTQSPSFLHLFDFLKLLGTGIYEIDKKLASGLFCDYLLPKIAVLTPKYPEKIFFYMSLLSFFIPGDSPDRSQVLKLLKEKLNDISTFIQSMAELVNSELDLPQEIIDLYLYYAEMGLKNPSPVIRASGVCILANLALRDLNSVLGCYDQIMSIKYDKWWEVQVQLVRLITNILTSSNEQNGSVGDDLVELLLEILRPSSPPNVLMAALSYCSPLLETYSLLTYPFMESLMSLPMNVLRPLLTTREEINYSYKTSLPVHISGLLLSWRPTDLSESFSSYVESNHLDRLEPNHLEIFYALVNSAIQYEELKTDHNTWEHVLSAVIHHLILLLGDPDLCKLTADCLLAIIQNSDFGLLICQNRLFVGVFRFIYPLNEEASILCQENLIEFVKIILSMNMPFSSALAQNIQEFANESSDNSAQALVGLIN